MVADIQGQFNNDVTNFVAFYFAISVEIEFLNLLNYNKMSHFQRMPKFLDLNQMNGKVLRSPLLRNPQDIRRLAHFFYFSSELNFNI